MGGKKRGREGEMEVRREGVKERGREEEREERKQSGR